MCIFDFRILAKIISEPLFQAADAAYVHTLNGNENVLGLELEEIGV